MVVLEWQVACRRCVSHVADEVLHDRSQNTESRAKAPENTLDFPTIFCHCFKLMGCSRVCG